MRATAAFLSDLSGTLLEEDERVIVTIKDPTAPDEVRVLDISIDEAAQLFGNKGAVRPRAGRKTQPAKTSQPAAYSGSTT